MQDSCLLPRWPSTQIAWYGSKTISIPEDFPPETIIQRTVATGKLLVVPISGAVDQARQQCGTRGRHPQL